MTSSSIFLITRIETDFLVSELENERWQSAAEVEISRNWDGSLAGIGRHFWVRSLWSVAAIYFRFTMTQKEPLVVNSDPQLNEKTFGLWERDVCEVFVAPDRKETGRYFEFEVAPTGEWLDLAIDVTSGERTTKWDYRSGMDAAVRIEDRVVMAIKVPWDAFGRQPRSGDVWLGNIFRCVGKEPGRGYLSWQPTFTEEPNFHMPARFGEFEFV